MQSLWLAAALTAAPADVCSPSVCVTTFVQPALAVGAGAPLLGPLRLDIEAVGGLAAPTVLTGVARLGPSLRIGGKRGVFVEGYGYVGREFRVVLDGPVSLQPAHTLTVGLGLGHIGKAQAGWFVRPQTTLRVEEDGRRAELLAALQIGLRFGG